MADVRPPPPALMMCGARIEIFSVAEAARPAAAAVVFCCSVRKWASLCCSYRSSAAPAAVAVADSDATAERKCAPCVVGGGAKGFHAAAAAEMGAEIGMDEGAWPLVFHSLLLQLLLLLFR